MSQTLSVRWPDRYRPEVCPVHVRNELDMAASPQQVWAALIDAPQWPQWYVNASNVRLLGDGPGLSLGQAFRWKTFGVTITSTVREFVPGERIAWDGCAPGLDVYHGWVLQPSDRGCRVLTEETQHGILVRLGQLFMPGRMFRFHQIWLQALEARACGAGAAQF